MALPGVKRVRKLLATLCVLLVTGSAFAAGTLDVVRQRGTLVVGVKADFPPFGGVCGRARATSGV